MIRIRTVAASIAAIAALGGLSACSSSGAGGGTDPASAPPTTSSATGSVTPTSAGTQSTGATSDAAVVDSGSSVGSGSGGSGSTQCAESQLRASVAADDIKGLDRHVLKLSFLNTSGTSCTLTGFPGAAIADDSGKQVQQAKRIVGGPVGGTIEKSATLTLRAGSTAYAYLEGSSTREKGAAQAGCDAAKFPRILVTPPNTRTPVPFAIGWPQCYSFEIHPVRQD